MIKILNYTLDSYGRKETFFKKVTKDKDTILAKEELTSLTNDGWKIVSSSKAPVISTGYSSDEFLTVILQKD